MNFNKTIIRNNNNQRPVSNVATKPTNLVRLPCDHELDIELYKIHTINQIILNKPLTCIECRVPYVSKQSDILKNIYTNIKKEKIELKGKVSIKNLSKEEFNTFKNFRKDYYLKQLDDIKDCTKYFDLVVEMFGILFDTTYFLIA